jgi:hypothetical protein
MTAITLVRPLLPVILAAELVAPGTLESFKAELIAGQPASLQGRVLEEFNRFARDITRCVGRGVGVGVALEEAVGVALCVAGGEALPEREAEAVLEGLAPRVRLVIFR